MIEMKGKYNEAKIFTDVVDSASIAQIQELCNQEFTAGSRIAHARHPRRGGLYHRYHYDHHQQSGAQSGGSGYRLRHGDHPHPGRTATRLQPH